MSYRTERALVGVCAMLVALACGGDEERSSGIGSGCPPTGCPQDGGADAPVDTGNEAAQDVATDTEKDTGSDEPYTGPTGTLRGEVFISNLPLFPVERTDQFPLYYPSSIAVWAEGKEYDATVDPSSGYVLEGIPIGQRWVVARDIDTQNGLVETAMQVEIVEGETSFDFPAITRNAFVTTLGALPEPILRDPLLAQVLVSFEVCGQPDQRLSGVVVEPPTGAQAVVVQTDSGWRADASLPTNETGLAFIVNLPASDWPGEMVEASYTYEGQSYSIPSFLIFKGGVTRLVVQHGC